MANLGKISNGQLLAYPPSSAMASICHTLPPPLPTDGINGIGSRLDKSFKKMELPRCRTTTQYSDASGIATHRNPDQSFPLGFSSLEYRTTYPSDKG